MFYAAKDRDGTYIHENKDVAASETKEAESIEMVPNQITQRLMGRYKNVMKAKFDVSSMENGQLAGLYISAKEFNNIGVKKVNNKMDLFYLSISVYKNTSILLKV